MLIKVNFIKKNVYPVIIELYIYHHKQLTQTDNESNSVVPGSIT